MQPHLGSQPWTSAAGGWRIHIRLCLQIWYVSIPTNLAAFHDSLALQGIDDYVYTPLWSPASLDPSLAPLSLTAPDGIQALRLTYSASGWFEQVHKYVALTYGQPELLQWTLDIFTAYRSPVAGLDDGSPPYFRLPPYLSSSSQLDGDQIEPYTRSFGSLGGLPEEATR